MLNLNADLPTYKNVRLIISQNLSELQPFLGNWSWKRCFWVFYFKNFLGKHPPRPKVPCAAKKFYVRCFKKYVHYFKKPVENPDTNQLIYLMMN